MKVSGFERTEELIKKKYENKKVFTKEELDEMNREIEALHEEKIKSIRNSEQNKSTETE